MKRIVFCPKWMLLAVVAGLVIGGGLINACSKEVSAAQAELQRAAAVRWKATLFSTKVTLPTAADLLPVIMAETGAFEPPLIYDSFPVAPGLDRRN